MGCFISTIAAETSKSASDTVPESVKIVTLPHVSLASLDSRSFKEEAADEHWDGFVDTLPEEPEFLQPKLTKRKSVKFLKAVEMGRNLDKLIA